MLKLLFYLIFGRRCDHAWSLVAEKEFPPVIEEFKKLHVHPSDAFLMMKACRRTYFAIVKCDKCGAIKEFEKRA